MPAIEPVGDPEQPGDPADQRLVIGRQGRKGRIGLLGPAAAVVAADQRHERAFAGAEADAVGVHDQLVAVAVVALVTHELPDIVQDAGGLEDVAFFRRAPHCLADLVHQREGEEADLLHVLAVRAAPVGELPHQLHRIHRRRRGGRRAHHLPQQSLPQAIGADRHTAGVEAFEQRGDDSQPGQDDVGPLRIEPRDAPALQGGARREPFQQVLHLGHRDLDAVHRLGGVAAPPGHRHPAEVGEGPARSDDPCAGPRPLGQLPREALPEVLAERADLAVLRPRAGDELLGQPDGAVRQRSAELDQAVDGADQLEAPAADVGDEGLGIVEPEMVADGAVGELGLVFGADDLEGEADLVAHPADELGAVLRLAHRGGGHRRDAGGAPPPGHVRHAAECRERAFDGLGVEPPGGGEPLGQPGLGLDLVDRCQPGRRVVGRRSGAGSSSSPRRSRRVSLAPPGPARVTAAALEPARPRRPHLRRDA